jgi:hypothetical protein
MSRGRRVLCTAELFCGELVSLRYRTANVVPRTRVLSAALGGAAATYLTDGDRPAQALSLEETMRRAPAYCPAESPEQQRADVRNGYDIGPALRVGY